MDPVLDQIRKIKALGILLYEDDIKDVPDLSRLHHWQYGLALAILGEVLENIYLLNKLVYGS